MGYVGTERYIISRVVDLSNAPVTGITLADFVVNPTLPVPGITDEYSDLVYNLIFERDTVACSDTLSWLDLQDGRYSLMYTPSAIGNDYIDIWYGPYGIRTIDNEVIQTAGGNESSNVVSLNQNYQSSDKYLITVPNPQTYALYVYNSSDWVQGRQDTLYALGTTALDTSGNWINSIVVLDPGTYHIVIISTTTIVVAFPFVVVS
ncbi:MAG: hypothetical protein WA766_11645 [Candidatus Acidiferrales bacterium]